MKSSLSIYAARALSSFSASAVDPEDMSDEELETAFNEAKSELNMGDEPTEPEQPTEVDNIEPDAAVDSDLGDEPLEATGSEEVVPADAEPTDTEEPKIVYEDEYFKLVDGQAQFQPIKINGEEIPIENINELYALGSKGGHFTQSMQEIAPYRRTISAMKENGVSEEQVNMLIEAKSGNKDAAAALMQQFGIDPIEVDSEPADGYAPKQYGQNEQQMAIADIQKQIGSDPEFTMTQNVIDQEWDPASRTAMAQDPTKILGLHEDIKTGVYQQVAPQAKKLAVMDGFKRSNLDYYMEAGARYYAVQDAENQRVAQGQQAPQHTNSKQKQAAGAPRGNSSKKPDVVDYLNMSDDEYDKMYDNIMSRV